MSLVSWIHDNAHVDDVDYGEQVVISFEARPSVVERARAKASDVAAPVDA
jgi:GTP-binding protein HflX